MYIFKIGINENIHDEFVKASPYCNLLQSSSWAKIKGNWSHEIVGVYENEQLVASSLVLIKRLPLKMTMMYIPRGPILDFKNKELLSFYIKSLKKWAKKYHCLFIKLDPGIHYCDYHLNEERELHSDAKEMMINLKENGLIHLGFTTDFSSTIQPRLHMAVYKEEFKEENFTKKGKKNLKIALRKNFETVFGKQEYLEDFTRVMNCTASRKGISLRGMDYYKLLLDTYKNDAFITLTYLDIKKTYEEIKARYDKCEKDLQECPENAKKKRFKLEELEVSLTREVKDFKRYLEEYGDKACVCGTLSVVFGNTSEILYAGMDNEFKRYMGPYITWQKTMQECLDRGCDYSNMGGIEGDLKGGLIDFKSVFYPVINEYIGEYDLPVNHLLYKLSNLAYKLRKSKNSHHS